MPSVPRCDLDIICAANLTHHGSDTCDHSTVTPCIASISDQCANDFFHNSDPTLGLSCCFTAVRWARILHRLDSGFFEFVTTILLLSATIQLSLSVQMITSG